jgi:hypothetical protein
MAVVAFILDWWRARLRRLDLEILWPTCLKMCEGDLDCARAAFAVHAFSDPAWVCLGEKELFDRIDRLE